MISPYEKLKNIFYFSLKNARLMRTKKLSRDQLVKNSKKKGRPKLMSEECLAEKMFQVFALRGYSSTSISDLTRATGMKPASLYLAFDNKEGMYAAALKHYSQTWLSGLKLILDDNSLSFKQRIHAFLESAFTLFTSSDTPPGCMMIFSALTNHSDESKFFEQLRDERLAFTDWLVREATIAKASGQLPKNLTPETFSHFIVTLERGLALTALDKPDSEVIRKMLDSVLSILFIGSCIQ